MEEKCTIELIDFNRKNNEEWLVSKYRSHHHQINDMDKFSFNIPLRNQYNT